MHFFHRAQTLNLHLRKVQTAALTLVLTTLFFLLPLSGGAGTAYAATMKSTQPVRPACANGFQEFVATHNWYPGDYDTITSCTGKSIKLIYQTDGNFVLYINGAAKWATGTNLHIYNVGYSPEWVTFDSHGEIVVYDWDSLPTGHLVDVWNSGSYGKGGTNLDLQEDGNLVIYKNWSTSPSNAIWASNTCCY